MANEKIDKRKVKQINGWKVNHPFSAANMFYAFFTLVLIAAPVAVLFIPLVTFGDGAVKITGIELFKYYAIDFLKLITGGTAGEIPTAPDGLQFLWSIFSSGSVASKFLISIGEGEEALVIADFLTISQASIIAILLLNSVFAFIYFIVLICKGYLRHAGHIKTIAVFDFIFSILFGVSFIVLFFVFMIAGYASEIKPWLALIPMGVYLILLIVLSSINSHNFKECVYEADLEYHEDEEKAVVTHVTEVHEIKKVNYEAPNTLPPNITSIGGHDFAENQNLEIANIPLGIDKIGNGAFANCLKLKVVSLPDSVQEIGFNCFFNCVSLERINYAGTKEQWRHIKRGSNWLAQAKTSEVVCVDGAIVVNPYH